MTEDTTSKKKEPKKSDLEERLSRQADAKKALLAKFKARPMVTDPEFVSRQERKARELEAVRVARLEAKEAARRAKIEEQERQREALLQDEEHQIALKREDRKARKAAAKADARAKRELQQQARAMRRAS